VSPANGVEDITQIGKALLLDITKELQGKVYVGWLHPTELIYG
jgi:hypothetical protein